MARTRRLNQLLDDISSRVRFPKGPMAVALSGGADSAALAGVARMSGVEVRAIHVDHGLQFSPRLSNAATEIANRLEISIEVAMVVLGPGSGMEERARRLRYEALEQRLGPGESILTGHTFDDLGETVLMRLARGSGLRGLAGIPESRDFIFRPFLRITRSETRELATLMSLPWVDDPTNDDSSVLRNRVRRSLRPLLIETFGVDPVESMARSALLVQEQLERFERLLDGLTIEAREGWARAPIGQIRALDPILVGHAIRLIWSRLGMEYPPDEAAVGRAIAVVGGAVVRADMMGGFVADREGSWLRIGRTVGS